MTAVTQTADRFEIALDDGTVAGFAQFVDHEGQRVFFHTEVDPAHSGQGLAGDLVGQALTATRDEGRQIVPVCPYVKRYMQTHDEWTDLVVPTTPAALAAIP